MKKIIVAIATTIIGVVGFANVASAHHLNVTGTTSCVRADGSWDWQAAYTIPNEPWAQGLTVVVTWSPGNSGTSSANFVDVTANGAWSNGNQGGGSVRIHKGQKCPDQTTTTTSTTTTVPETTTTTTVPEETTTSVSTDSTTSSTMPETTTTTSDTSTTSSVVTSTTAPATTTSSQVSTTAPSTSAPITQTAQDTPTQNGATPQAVEELPTTGAGWTIFLIILAVVLILVGIKLVRRSRL